MKIHLLFLLLVSSFACSTLKPDAASIVSSSAKGVKIAVVNFRVEGGKTLSQHMARIEEFAEQASTAQASYLLLPELTVFDLLPENIEDDNNTEELLKLADSAPDYQEALASIGQKYKLNIIGASMVVKEGKHFLNRALFINPKGKAQTQDKLRPTPWEARLNFKGAKEVELFQTPDFSFVILICHDAEFPDISYSLATALPEVIFVPSMTDDQYGLNRVKFTSAARAIEHMAYVLMTGTTGIPGATWHAYLGKNHFFLPQNKYFIDMESPASSSEETLTFYHLDLARLKAAREDVKQIYPVRDMKK